MVIAFMARTSDAALEQKLDKDEYSSEELVSIKTVLHLPYYASSPEFERAYGSVDINGVVYEYVKKRVYNDTLELLCLPNTARTKLNTIRKDIIESSADNHASLPLKKGATTLKISLPDYCQQTESLTVFSSLLSTQYRLLNESFSLTAFVRPQERPPQA